MKKAFSIGEVRDYIPSTVNFDGAWLESFGNPELKGSWIIWGNSGNGKTTFCLQLAMYFTRFCKVVYNSMEEGLSKSMQESIARLPVESVSKYRFKLLDKMSLPELRELLGKRNSPRVVVIDSLQYTGLNYSQYKELTDAYKSKLFIFVSHADGREPKGEVAKSVRYDSNVKVYVKNFTAYPQSRYGGGEPFVVWEAESRKQIKQDSIND